MQLNNYRVFKVSHMQIDCTDKLKTYRTGFPKFLIKGAILE